MGANFSEICFKMDPFLFKKMRLKISSVNGAILLVIFSNTFKICLSLNVLAIIDLISIKYLCDD